MMSHAPNPPVSALDGWRGLAALIVLISHYSNTFGIWHGILGQGAGQTGVMLFFILSGYLMARLHAGTVFSAEHVATYSVKRVARIYPLFFIIAAVLVIRTWFGGSSNFWGGCAGPLLRQWLLIDSGISVLWTVRVEMIFYAIFIMIWLVASKVGRRMTIGLLIVAIAILSFRNLGYGGMVGATSRYFLFGVLSEMLHRDAAPARFNGVISGLTILTLAALPLTYPVLAKMLLGANVDPWRNDWTAVEVVIFFNLVLRDSGPVSAVLSAPLARWLGSISYSLYALQPLLLDFWNTRLGSSAPLVTASVVLTSLLASSAVSHRIIERPAQSAVLRAMRRCSYQSV